MTKTLSTALQALTRHAVRTTAVSAIALVAIGCADGPDTPDGADDSRDAPDVATSEDVASTEDALVTRLCLSNRCLGTIYGKTFRCETVAYSPRASTATRGYGLGSAACTRTSYDASRYRVSYRLQSCGYGSCSTIAASRRDMVGTKLATIPQMSWVVGISRQASYRTAVCVDLVSESGAVTDRGDCLYGPTVTL